MSIKHKSYSVVSMIILVMLTVSGCASRGRNATSSDQKNKVLKIAVANDIGTMSPHKISGESFNAQAMVYQGLVDVAKKGKIVPQLATSWKISNKGKDYQFNLRKGVKFSDGTPFNSKVVVKNFNYIFKNKSQFNWFALTTHLKSWRSDGPYKFNLYLDQPYNGTLDDLAMIRPIRFLSPKDFPNHGSTVNGKIKKPVGTGPFVMVKHVPNQYATFVRNKYYWGKKPSLKKVVMKIITDPETRVNALRSGSIDMIIGYSTLMGFDNFKTFKNNSNYVTKVSSPTSSRLLELNTSRKFMKSLLLRKAIASAINKNTISKKLLAGVEKPANTIFAPTMPYANVEQKVPSEKLNLYKAKLFLKKAGWEKGRKGLLVKNGHILKLNFPYINSDANSKIIAQYLQMTFRKLGIKINIYPEEENNFWNNLSDGNFDMAIIFSWGSPWDPHSTLNSMTVKTKGGGSGYIAQLGIPAQRELDNLITKVQITNDKDKEIRLYKKIYVILHENVAYVPLSYQALIAVYPKNTFNKFKFLQQENELPLQNISYK